MSKAKPITRRHPIVLRELEVARIAEISPQMRRVTLRGAQLQAFEKDGLHLPAFRADGPDDHVKIILPDPRTGQMNLPRQTEGMLDWSGGTPIGRSYTPRAYDPQSGELHLDFVLHGHGPAASWAAAAKPGDMLHIAGPKSSLLVPEQAEWYLLVGDETALPAIANWLEALPPQSPVTAIIQISSPKARIALTAPEQARIIWIEDADLRAEALVEAVAALDWPDGEGFVWGAGEREAVKLLRSHVLNERGHSRDGLDIVAYWHKGVEDAALDVARRKLRQLSDLLAPYALRTAVTLRLPDLVVGGANSVEALIEQTGADAQAMRLLVPVLLEYGILDGTPDALTVGLLGQLVREDRHDFEHLSLDTMDTRMDLAWAGLHETVTKGRRGYDAVFGTDLWSDIAAHSHLADSYNDEQSEWADYWAETVAQYVDPGPSGTVCDIGGGSGVLLAAVLRRHPEAKGIVVELPEAAGEARAALAHAGLGERSMVMAQSFFETLPTAPIQIMAHVLRDWPDAEAINLLERAGAAAGQGGEIVVVEPDVETKSNPKAALHLYTVLGGRLRSRTELDALAAAAGLVPVRYHRTGPDLIVLVYRRG